MIHALALAGVLLGAAPQSDTSALGRLRDGVSGTPIVGARVEFSVGAESWVGLSDDGGEFQTSVTGRGLLTVTRIGYGVWADSVEFVPGGLTEIEVESAPIELAGVTGTTENSCPTTPEEREAAFAVYIDLRRSLAEIAANEEQSSRTFVLQLMRLVRDSDRYGRPIFVRDTSLVRSPRILATDPAEVLAAHGYARVEPNGEVRYLAPNAAMVADDSFLTDYCLRVQEGELEFWPRSNRPVVDVRGSLRFVERRGSREPFALEYQYAGVLPFVETHMMPGFEEYWRAEVRESAGGYVRTRIQRPLVPGDRFGGSVRFDRVADGTFLTTSWEIRGVRLGHNGSFGAGGAEITPIAYSKPTSARLVALVPDGG
jgi:hypothetical protein